MIPSQLEKIRSILVVLKKSKYELDLEYYRSVNELKKICKIQNDCFDLVYNSHLRQVNSRESLKEIFPDATFIFREGLTNTDLDEFDLVIALGGDNHFTFVTHHVTNSLVLGCNSDPKTSTGALLSFHVDDIRKAWASQWKKSKVEHWTLISVKIEYPDGRKVQTLEGISEISVRNNSPDLTSRYILDYDGIVEEKKCSGLLVYTGAGSTGWVMAAENHDTSFGKEEPYFRAYSRELRNRNSGRYKLDHFTVTDSFVLTSEMHGGISIDSLAETIYDFPPGSKAEFSVSPRKLSVLVNNG